jgi:hypothetical protein
MRPAPPVSQGRARPAACEAKDHEVEMGITGAKLRVTALFALPNYLTCPSFLF